MFDSHIYSVIPGESYTLAFPFITIAYLVHFTLVKVLLVIYCSTVLDRPIQVGFIYTPTIVLTSVNIN